MPIAYTPDPANALPASVNLPEDDVDDEAAGSVNVPFEALLDAVARLEYQDDPWWPVALGYPTNKDIFGTDWNYSFVLGAWNQVQNVAPNAIAWALQLPARGKLLAVDIRFGGDIIGGGPHAGQPGTMPALALYAYLDGTPTTLASASDTWVNIATYDAAHWLSGGSGVTIGGGGHTINPSEQIILAFAGEYGANALANALGILSARIKIGAP